ncbi:hypothetical protein RRG08_047406 [Elysia crispata]|uniref:Uncharacterized protein n=1 Tax=Elysia crispata TaxID=231223 RepID=A0AAE1D569_9GAST|nr:hypothetical protein RRG08_047406 [Elysia crispata]
MLPLSSTVPNAPAQPQWSCEQFEYFARHCCCLCYFCFCFCFCYCGLPSAVHVFSLSLPSSLIIGAATDNGSKHRAEFHPLFLRTAFDSSENRPPLKASSVLLTMTADDNEGTRRRKEAELRSPPEGAGASAASNNRVKSTGRKSFQRNPGTVNGATAHDKRPRI